MTTRRVVLAALGIGLGTRLTPAPAAASDACGVPPEVATARAEQVTFAAIGSAQPAATPGQTLTLYRFTMPPGYVVEPHRHPGATILSIEAGEMGYTLLAGAVRVWRGPGMGGGGIEEPAPGDPEMVLRAGDALTYDRDAAHSARTVGDQPVVVLAVTLFADGEPSSSPYEV